MSEVSKRLLPYTFQLELFQLRIQLNFSCSYFLEWKTSSKDPPLMSPQYPSMKGDEVFFLKHTMSARVELQMDGAGKLQKQESRLSLFLVSKNCPGQPKLTGLLNFDLAEIVSDNPYAKQCRMPLKYCSSKATILFSLTADEDVSRVAFGIKANLFRSNDKNYREPTLQVSVEDEREGAPQKKYYSENKHNRVEKEEEQNVVYYNVFVHKSIEDDDEDQNQGFQAVYQINQNKIIDKFFNLQFQNTQQNKETKAMQLIQFKLQQKTQEKGINKGQEIVQEKQINKVQEKELNKVQENKAFKVQEKQINKIQDKKIHKVQYKIQEKELNKVQENKAFKVQQKEINKIQDKKIFQIKQKVQNKEISKIQEKAMPQIQEKEILKVQEKRLPKVQEKKVLQIQVEILPETFEINAPKVQQKMLTKSQQKIIKKFSNYKILNFQQKIRPIRQQKKNLKTQEKAIPKSYQKVIPTLQTKMTRKFSNNTTLNRQRKIILKSQQKIPRFSLDTSLNLQQMTPKSQQKITPRFMCNTFYRLQQKIFSAFQNKVRPTFQDNVIKLRQQYNNIDQSIYSQEKKKQTLEQKTFCYENRKRQTSLSGKYHSSSSVKNLRDKQVMKDEANSISNSRKNVGDVFKKIQQIDAKNEVRSQMSKANEFLITNQTNKIEDLNATLKNLKEQNSNLYSLIYKKQEENKQFCEHIFQLKQKCGQYQQIIDEKENYIRQIIVDNFKNLAIVKILNETMAIKTAQISSLENKLREAQTRIKQKQHFISREGQRKDIQIGVGKTQEKALSDQILLLKKKIIEISQEKNKIRKQKQEDQFIRISQKHQYQVKIQKMKEKMQMYISRPNENQPIIREWEKAIVKELNLLIKKRINLRQNWVGISKELKETKDQRNNSYLKEDSLMRLQKELMQLKNKFYNEKQMIATFNDWQKLLMRARE